MSRHWRRELSLVVIKYRPQTCCRLPGRQAADVFVHRRRNEEKTKSQEGTKVISGLGCKKSLFKLEKFAVRVSWENSWRCPPLGNGSSFMNLVHDLQRGERIKVRNWREIRDTKTQMDPAGSESRTSRFCFKRKNPTFKLPLAFATMLINKWADLEQSTRSTLCAWFVCLEVHGSPSCSWRLVQSHLLKLQKSQDWTSRQKDYNSNEEVNIKRAFSMDMLINYMSVQLVRVRSTPSS